MLFKLEFHLRNQRQDFQFSSNIIELCWNYKNVYQSSIEQISTPFETKKDSYNIQIINQICYIDHQCMPNDKNINRPCTWMSQQYFKVVLFVSYKSIFLVELLSCQTSILTRLIRLLEQLIFEFFLSVFIMLFNFSWPLLPPQLPPRVVEKSWSFQSSAQGFSTKSKAFLCGMMIPTRPRVMPSLSSLYASVAWNTYTF